MSSFSFQLNMKTRKFILWPWCSIMQLWSKPWDSRLLNSTTFTNSNFQTILSFMNCMERGRMGTRNQICLHFQHIKWLTKSEWRGLLFTLCGSSPKTTVRGNSLPWDLSKPLSPINARSKSWKQSIWTEWPQVVSAFAETSLINKFSIRSNHIFCSHISIPFHWSSS